MLLLDGRDLLLMPESKISNGEEEVSEAKPNEFQMGRRRRR
jgi:hypothetical protein